ncbi:MAG: hypothetical protein LBC77_05015 [Spirochaetaceae bacterium]|jgi:hypothetical protein|nr:hypothetical protein [Spirochaetaceae bacterium]
MKRRVILSLILLCLQAAICGQSVPREFLRGEVSVELEPVFLLNMGISSPIDVALAARWALEDSAAAFSAMIFGWEFEYEPGERARELRENLSLTPLGAIRTDDASLRVTEAAVRENVYYLWCDYELSASQKRRITAWNASDTKGVQATGYAPLMGADGAESREALKRGALEDAMKKAARAALKLTERNRPRIVKGVIALEAFPVYRIFQGNWAALAKFRLKITEITPFPVY